MKRKLASIRKVKELREIKGADLIELAIIDGWQCVVKKGEFKKGDMGVYFEIDSYLPLDEKYEFLRKSCYKKMGEKEGLRIKTIKLRKKISQGLFLPLSIFENLSNEVKIVEGNDLTELLNIQKYDPPIPACLSGAIAGNFPSFIKKTQQERIQNLWDEYNKELLNDGSKNIIKNMFFEPSIKLDGTSMTCFAVDPKLFPTKSFEKTQQENKELNNEYYLGVCGRNFELQEKEGNTYWKVFNADIKDKLLKYHLKTKRNIALQGEMIGEGIQKNRENIKGQKFFCFEIWDIDKQRYLVKSERLKILEEMNIQSIPTLDNIQPFIIFKTIDDILLFAEGESLNSNNREGLVFKSIELINGETISFKVISNKFLLKNE